MAINLAMCGFSWSFVFLLISVCHLHKTKSQSTIMFGPCDGDSPCTNNNNADVVLGGLFPIHNVICNGNVSLEALQWVEAMNDAVKTVNTMNIIQDGQGQAVKLGYEIRDTCRTPSYALDEVLSFLSTTTSCGGQASSSKLVGVVGPFSSSVSIRATRLLQLFNIPMVSFGSTSPQLSDKDRYPYFLRTLPSDSFLARAIIRAAKDRGWSFINLVFTDDAFGRDGSASVAREARQAGICVGSRTAVREDAEYNNVHGYSDYGNAWASLLDRAPENRSTVTVLFTQETNARHFFLYGQTNETVRVKALERNITFLGVDSWGDIRTAVLNPFDGMPLVTALGAVSPIPFNKNVVNFDRAFQSLSPNANGNNKNPWLRTAWEVALRCSIADVSCRSRSLVSDNYVQSSKVAMVYDAVYAFAYALRSILMNTTLCPMQRKTCASLRDGKILLQALQGGSFPGENKNPFRFNKNGDPLESLYAEKNLVTDPQATIKFPTVALYSATEMSEVSRFDCKLLGDFLFSGGVCYAVQFTPNLFPIVWNDGTNSTPVSICSSDCARGQSRKAMEATERNDLSCCWICSDCTEQTFTNTSNSDECRMCSLTEHVMKDDRGVRNIACRSLRIESYTIDHPLALIVAIVAAASQATVIAMIGMLVVWWEGDRYLPWPIKSFPTAISLAGVFITLSSAPLSVIRPTPAVCSTYVSLAAGGLTLALAPVITFVWEWYMASHNIFHEEYSAESTFYQRNRSVTDSRGHRESGPDIVQEPSDRETAESKSQHALGTAGTKADKSNEDVRAPEVARKSGSIPASTSTVAISGFTKTSWMKTMVSFMLLFGILLGASLALSGGDVKDGVISHEKRTLTCSDSGAMLFGFSWTILLLLQLLAVDVIAVKAISPEDNTFEADLIKNTLFSVLICTVCVIACTAVYTSDSISVIRNGSFSLASTLIMVSLIGLVHGPRFYYIFRHRSQLQEKYEKEVISQVMVLQEEAEATESQERSVENRSGQDASTVNSPTEPKPGVPKLIASASDL